MKFYLARLNSFAMIAALLLGAARHAQAQHGHRWALLGELGSPRYSGMIGSDVDSIEVVPARRTEWRIGLEHALSSRVVVSVVAGVASPGVEAVTTGASATIDGGLDLYELRPLFDLQILGRSSGTQVTFGAGPAIQFWQPAGLGTRTRLAFDGRVRVIAPFTGSLGLTVSGELGVTPSSWAHQDEVPENHEPRAMWRRSVFLGLRIGM